MRWVTAAIAAVALVVGVSVAVDESRAEAATFPLQQLTSLYEPGDSIRLCITDGATFHNVTWAFSAMWVGVYIHDAAPQYALDIIPPNKVNPAGQNWNAVGQAIHANGCVAV